MGINIGIDIANSPKAPCRELRTTVIRIHAGSEHMDLMDRDLVVPLERAKEIAAECADRIGGLALPRFVADIPGSRRKTPIEEL